MAMGSKTGKVVISVVLLLAAVLIFLGSLGKLPGQTDQAAQAVEAPRDLICTKCGHHFQLSGKEAIARFDAAPDPKPPADASPRIRAARGNRPPKMIACEKCNEFAAVNAAKCEQHGAYFPKINADGSRGRCPQCPVETPPEAPAETRE
jgi:hypothetical protein